MPLEPLPETQEALDTLARWGARDLTAELLRQAELVEDVVPNLVGMSVAIVRDGLTFTLAASRDHLALLDAIQYIFGGPCVDAALHDAPVRSGDNDAGLAEEKRWEVFARAGAARGVLSTLSLPIHAHGHVLGGVNLYAATPHAFAGREEDVARLLGAWAPGAVHNADLAFSTEVAARRAPQVLEDLTVLNQAIGVVAATRRVDEEQAGRIIADAAARAGQDELAVPRELLHPYRAGGEAT